MGQGLADPAVGGVKPAADEDMATYLRRKLLESDRKVGAKGAGHVNEAKSSISTVVLEFRKKKISPRKDES